MNKFEDELNRANREAQERMAASKTVSKKETIDEIRARESEAAIKRAKYKDIYVDNVILPVLAEAHQVMERTSGVKWDFVKVNQKMDFKYVGEIHDYEGYVQRVMHNGKTYKGAMLTRGVSGYSWVPGTKILQVFAGFSDSMPLDYSLQSNSVEIIAGYAKQWGGARSFLGASTLREPIDNRQFDINLGYAHDIPDFVNRLKLLEKQDSDEAQRSQNYFRSQFAETVSVLVRQNLI